MLDLELIVAEHFLEEGLQLRLARCVRLGCVGRQRPVVDRYFEFLSAELQWPLIREMVLQQ